MCLALTNLSNGWLTKKINPNAVIYNCGGGKITLLTAGKMPTLQASCLLPLAHKPLRSIKNFLFLCISEIKDAIVPTIAISFKTGVKRWNTSKRQKPTLLPVISTQLINFCIIWQISLRSHLSYLCSTIGGSHWFASFWPKFLLWEVMPFLKRITLRLSSIQE